MLLRGIGASLSLSSDRAHDAPDALRFAGDERCELVWRARARLRTPIGDLPGDLGMFDSRYEYGIKLDDDRIRSSSRGHKAKPGIERDAIKACFPHGRSVRQCRQRFR